VPVCRHRRLSAPTIWPVCSPTHRSERRATSPSGRLHPRPTSGSICSPMMKSVIPIGRPRPKSPRRRPQTSPGEGQSPRIPLPCRVSSTSSPPSAPTVVSHRPPTESVTRRPLESPGLFIGAVLPPTPTPLRRPVRPHRAGSCSSSTVSVVRPSRMAPTQRTVSTSSVVARSTTCRAIDRTGRCSVTSPGRFSPLGHHRGRCVLPVRLDVVCHFFPTRCWRWGPAPSSGAWSLLPPWWQPVPGPGISAFSTG
jgi:hypothetical protein